MTFVQLAGPPDVPAHGSSMGVSNVDRARHEDTVQFDRDVPDEAYSVQSDARTEGSEPIPLPEVDSAPAVSAGGQASQEDAALSVPTSATELSELVAVDMGSSSGVKFRCLLRFMDELQEIIFRELT